MLHGIIKVQGNCLEEIIFQKQTIFYMFSFKSLASGALIIGIIVIADNKPMELCNIWYKNI